MAELENSEVVKHVLENLISISSRKTTLGTAISTLDDSLKKLRPKYDFLKHVEIKDTRYFEIGEPVSVMSSINNIRSNDVGKALQDIIKNMNTNLGKNAGYFFIKELQNNIGGNYTSVMKDMGVDLGLLQLETEINKLGKTIARK